MDNVYPVLLRGEKKGTLTVAQEGLHTVFSAKCEDPGRLLRLSVYGGGREGYLGVMQPENGVLRLQKRLSRCAMAGFPAAIEYAAEAGQACPPEAEKPRPDEKPRPAEKPKTRTDILWYAVGDGSLYTVWNDRPYRAVPVSPWGLPMEKAVGRRTIAGVEYAVFPLRDGRI